MCPNILNTNKSYSKAYKNYCANINVDRQEFKDINNHRYKYILSIYCLGAQQLILKL